MKRIAITGVSRGLGRALVEAWANDENLQLFGCSRSAAVMAELCSEYPQHHFTAVDVSSDESVETWAREVLDEGPPDLLINNAAVINPNALLWEVPAEEFDAVVDVNIKGVANVIRRLVPSMVKRRSGVIVNLSSGWGRSVSPEVAAYCATKWAMEGLTRALAEELPKGMAAIPLNPGIIDTEMLQSCFGGESSSYPSAAQWARIAAPYLLSLGPEQNGQSLTVPI